MEKSKHSFEVELISALFSISFTARNLADRILEENEIEEGGIEKYETDCKNCANCSICKGSCR